MALELNPHAISSLRWIPLQMVSKYADQPFREGLLDLADKTIKLKPTSAEAYGVRGRLYAALGNRKLARADFDKARQLEPTLRWAPLDGPASEAYVIHFGLLQPTGDALDQTLADLRQELRSVRVARAWLQWVSCWLPAVLESTDGGSGTVFVSDMPWVRSSGGHGSSVVVRQAAHAVRESDFGRFDGTTPIAGLPYSKGIWTSTFADGRPADVVLDVAGREYVALRAHVGACNEGTAKFQVLVDGKVKHETLSPKIGMIEPISVDVANASEVVLRILNMADGKRGEAGWGYARFIEAGAEDPLEVCPAQFRSAIDANAAFFLAEVHWRLDHKELARRWYDKAVEWMDKNKSEDEKLRGYRDEAAKLLGIAEKPATAQEQPEKP